jgi:hypothetical protein
MIEGMKSISKDAERAIFEKKHRLSRYFRGHLASKIKSPEVLTMLYLIKKALPAPKDTATFVKSLNETMSQLTTQTHTTINYVLQKAIKNHVKSKIYSITDPNPGLRELPLTFFQNSGSCRERSRKEGGSYSFLMEKFETYYNNNSKLFTRHGKAAFFDAQKLKNYELEGFDLTTPEGLVDAYEKVKEAERRVMFKDFIDIESEMILNLYYLEPFSLEVDMGIAPCKAYKARPTSLNSAVINAKLDVASTQVTRIIKRLPSLRPQFTGNPKSVETFFDNMVKEDDESFYSSDLTGATNTISRQAAQCVVYGLSESLGWDDLTTRCAIASVSDLKINYKIGDMQGTFLTKAGTQMGFPLSFSILCLLQTFCAEYNASSRARRSYTSYGDDLTGLWNETAFLNYVSNAKSVGFIINQEKCAVHPRNFMFCSEIYFTTSNQALKEIHSTDNFSVAINYRHKKRIIRFGNAREIWNYNARLAKELGFTYNYIKCSHISTPRPSAVIPQVESTDLRPVWVKVISSAQEQVNRCRTNDLKLKIRKILIHQLPLGLIKLANRKRVPLIGPKELGCLGLPLIGDEKLPKFIRLRAATILTWDLEDLATLQNELLYFEKTVNLPVEFRRAARKIATDLNQCVPSSRGALLSEVRDTLLLNKFSQLIINGADKLPTVYKSSYSKLLNGYNSLFNSLKNWYGASPMSTKKIIRKLKSIRKVRVYVNPVLTRLSTSRPLALQSVNSFKLTSVGLPGPPSNNWDCFVQIDEELSLENLLN